MSEITKEKKLDHKISGFKDCNSSLHAPDISRFGDLWDLVEKFFTWSPACPAQPRIHPERLKKTIKIQQPWHVLHLKDLQPSGARVESGHNSELDNLGKIERLRTISFPCG